MLECNYDATQFELFQSFAWKMKSIDQGRLKGYIALANTTAVRHEEVFETMVSTLALNHGFSCPPCVVLEHAVSVVLDPYRRCVYDTLDLPAMDVSWETVYCNLLRPTEEGIKEILAGFITAVTTAMLTEDARNEL
jgi:hypothetical protein